MSEPQTLKPLPYPVYFLYKKSNRWDNLMKSPTPPPVEQVYEEILHVDEIWCVQTYIHLKRRGLDVHLVPDYVPQSICVNVTEELAIKDFPFNSYVVVCQHDRGRPEICEQRIVQNHLNVIKHNDHFLPHWPQPGLQPRDSYRGTKVENMVYKGMDYNLAKPFRNPEFLQQLEARSITLSCTPGTLKNRKIDWTDYTQADVVLAVRNCTEYDLSIKPPSKLINAWLAGCPALLGPEPAYQHLRKSELDYIEIRSPDDVISALVRLQENPKLYSAMVNNGFERAKAFTPDRLALLWRDILAGPVAEGYKQWLCQSPITKLVGRPIQFTWRAIRHKQQNQYYRYHIFNGPRLFPDLD